LRQCATTIPQDVEDALRQCAENAEGMAADVMASILQNIDEARSGGLPLCQDTGTPVFYVSAPNGMDLSEVRASIGEAVIGATSSVPLRPNSVDPLTGANPGDNTGEGLPLMHFERWGNKTLRIEVLLKGGGSENLTRLYRLPDQRIGAGRDINGIGRCVLDSVHAAQGSGCPPYFLGIAAGGMADSCLAASKRQLLRNIDDTNPDAMLESFEADMLDRANELGIGPAGLGGFPTLLSAKACAMARHPASFFVGISFSCWALRRGSIEVDP